MTSFLKIFQEICMGTGATGHSGEDYPDITIRKPWEVKVSTQVTRCESCQQNIYKEFCDACREAISDSDVYNSDRIEFRTTRDGRYYNLQIRLCESCRNACISIENIASVMIRNADATLDK